MPGHVGQSTPGQPGKGMSGQPGKGMSGEETATSLIDADTHTLPRMRVGVPDPDPLRPGRHRPARSFRAVGVFVLVLGAVSGVYLGVARPGGSQGTPAGAVGVGPSPTLDAERQQALAHAQERAAAAAAEAAAQAKKASEVPETAEPTKPAAPKPSSSYPVPASCNEYSGNRGIGCALLLEAGFGLAEMPCLEKLWTKESGWNPLSSNRSTGAYGIPQALPGSKMSVYGSDWRTNPVPQIKWGLNYIKNRYRTPCGAWSHFQASGWY
jgi:hypothetical protein